MQNSLAQVVLNVGWLLHTFIIIHHHVTFTFNLLKLFSVPLLSETSVVTDFGECFSITSLHYLELTTCRLLELSWTSCYSLQRTP